METSPAKSMASPPGGTERQEVQLACFRVGNALYALDIMRIREIIRPQKLTEVPKAPRFIEGVIHLRGTVIPVADLRKRFDQPCIEASNKSRIVICVLAGKLVGLLVDEVMEVRRYGRQDVTAPPPLMKGPEAEFLLGVARRDQDLVMILDLERILSADEQLALHKLE